MTFDPSAHLVKLKGNALYLPVTWRLVWLREEYPDAIVETEMVTMDLDRDLYVFRATVTLPNGASATGYGSETAKDFPAAPLEKAETKALGRALAALGLGTQFALEIEESEGVQAGEARPPQTGRSTPTRTTTQPPARTTQPAARSGNGSGSGTPRPEPQVNPDEAEGRKLVRARLSAAFPEMTVNTWRELVEFAHEKYGLDVPTAEQEHDPEFRMSYLEVLYAKLPVAEGTGTDEEEETYRTRLAEAESIAAVSAIMHEAKEGGTLGAEVLKELAQVASERVAILRSTAV